MLVERVVCTVQCRALLVLSSLLWTTFWGCGGRDVLKDQSNPALHFDLVELFLSSNAYDAASPVASKLYHDHPTDPRPSYYLGVILRERGVFEEAERYFLEAIKRDANFALAYDALGILYGMQNQLDRALSAHRRATEISPKGAKLWHNLGFALTLSRAYPRAVKAYQKSITLAPNHKKTYVNLGMTYGVMGQYTEATRMFKQALSPAEVWLNLGLIQERKGELKRASKSFDEALKIQPQLQSAQRGLRRIKRAKKRASAMRDKRTKTPKTRAKDQPLNP